MHICTMFDHNYLPRGLVLYRTLMANAACSELYVLCLSDACYAQLKKLDLPGLIPVPLAALEQDSPALLQAKNDGRSLIEYYFTLSPHLPLYLLRRYGMAVLAYVDADGAFYGDPDSILPSIANTSVAIVGHRFPPRLRHLEKFGRFNVGFQVFKNDARGLACLEWWRDRCLEWCHDRFDNGRFADQKYLDSWPTLFDASEMQHKGLNTAPWNIERYTFLERDGRIYVDEDPLLFFHFHDLKHLWGPFWQSGAGEYGIRLPKVLLCKLYRPYIEMLRQEQAHVSSTTKRQSIRHGRQHFLQKIRLWAKLLLKWRTMLLFAARPR